MAKRTPRVLSMLVLTCVFFLLELVVGEMTGSVALVADSFHMLSDVVALVVSYQAIRLGKSSGPNKRNTYGWQRAEQLGALVNGVFLLALVFTIVIEAIQRFITPQDIVNPKLVLIVGGIGLVFNISGMLIFGHAGHGHSHGGHGHSEVAEDVPVDEEDEKDGKHGHSHAHTHSKMQGANIRALFLHVLGDALGNIGVIISALVIWLTPYSWRFYFDPLISILLSLIMLFNTIPLIYHTSLLLLQGIPEGVDVGAITQKLLDIPGIVDVHELHVWQLRDDKIVASVHLAFQHPGDYLAQAPKIKELFHKYNIHSTTVQPEFLSDAEGDNSLPSAASVIDKLNPFSPSKQGYNRVDVVVDEAPAEEITSLPPNDIAMTAVAVAKTSCQMACTTDCDEPQCCDVSSKENLRKRPIARKDTSENDTIV